MGSLRDELNKIAAGEANLPLKNFGEGNSEVKPVAVKQTAVKADPKANASSAGLKSTSNPDKRIAVNTQAPKKTVVTKKPEKVAPKVQYTAQQLMAGTGSAPR